MPDDPIARSLLDRFGTMKALREANWEPKWQDIADFVVGRRDFTRQETDGRRREVQIYDTTGRNMVNLLSGGLHSLLVNPATDWFDLRTGDPQLMENHEVRLWLEQTEAILYSIFHSPQARFTSQMDELFLDLVTFGSGGLFVGDPPGRQVLYSARPLNEIYFAEDPYGVVDTVYRRFQMTARQVLTQWGSGATEKAQKEVEANRPETKLWLLHCVWPSTEASTPRGFQRIPLPWSSAFVAEEDKQVLGRVGGFHEMPYLIPRWRVDGGEIYGRGPAEDALADQKMTSQMKLTTLQAGQMAVAPPFLTEDDSSIVHLDFRPFGRNIVRAGGMLNPPIQALDVRANAVISNEMIRDTRRQVEEAFHFELLKLIQNRGLTPMTAEQARLIHNSVQRLLSPILGRLHTELLGPLIDRTFGIAVRRGLLPPAPPVLQGHPIEVEYQNPITRAQREGEATATAQWLAQVAQFGQVDPHLLDLVNGEEALRFLADQQGVPAKIVRSRQDLARLRKMQAEIEQEQQQQAQLQQGAEMIGKLAPMLGPGKAA